MFEASWWHLVIGCMVSLLTIILFVKHGSLDFEPAELSYFLIIVQFLAPIFGYFNTLANLEAPATLSNILHASLIATIFSFGMWLIILFKSCHGNLGLMIFIAIFGFLFTIAGIFGCIQSENNYETKTAILEESCEQDVIEDFYLANYVNSCYTKTRE